MMMVGGAAVAIILIIIVAVSTSKPKPIEPHILDWYTKIEELLDRGKSAHLAGKPLVALEFYDTARQYIENDAAKYSVDNPNFPKFAGKYKEGQALTKKLLKIEQLIKSLQNGKGVADVVKISKDKDPLIRLASIMLIEQKVKDEAKLQKALLTLAKDSDKKVKDRAIELVIKVGGVPALPWLMERVDMGPEHSVDAILRISKIVDVKALPAYFKCLKKLDPKRSKEDLADSANIIKNINKVDPEAALDVMPHLLEFRKKCPKDLQGMIDKIGTKYKKPDSK